MAGGGLSSANIVVTPFTPVVTTCWRVQKNHAQHLLTLSVELGIRSGGELKWRANWNNRAALNELAQFTIPSFDVAIICCAAHISDTTAHKSTCKCAITGDDKGKHSISNCLRGKRSTALGFHWQYAEQ
ncbi:hypothetical protein CKO09_10625 [Chromatium weissei]|nr:hypothetical protein [Chromatium weissei]